MRSSHHATAPERHSVGVGADDDKYTRDHTMTDGTDGGYYAIKGFLYQFDHALIEMLKHPTATVAFENRQDIDYDDFVLQIKHKETQDFKPAKVRKAVAQLIELFTSKQSLKLVLYCYFRDKAASDWQLTLAELDDVLGGEASHYSKADRHAFLKAFVVRFSDDYETHFAALLELIKSDFSIRTDEEAILYHSLFRSHLLSRSILPKDRRTCSRGELAGLRAESEQIVFYSAYSRYLGDAKYEDMIRKSFFTLRTPNIENFERLFILEAESAAVQETVLECVMRISRKYFRRGKSPQPYVCLRGASGQFINQVKRSMLDKGVTFFDGTHFDGDRFRPDELIRKRLNDSAPCLKFAPESSLPDILSRAHFEEVFQIYVSSPLKIAPAGRHVCIAVNDLAQAARIMK